MKKLPFAVQLSLIVFLILIIPFIILMSYTGTTTLREAEVEIARSSLEHIELNSRFTENFMSNITANVHRFAAYQDFFIYDGLQKYASIQGNVENGLKVQKLQRDLASIARTDDSIHSIFMFFDDSDYIISSDRGIVEQNDYSSLSWLRNLSAQKQGQGGIWVPRILQPASVREILRGQDTGYTVPVISYVYNLSRLITTIRGTIVINIKESYIASILNPELDRENSMGIMLMQSDGKLITHPKLSNFNLQAKNLPHIADILDSGQNSGYAFYKEGSGQTLYTWLKSNYYDWVFVSVQSMAPLLDQSNRTIRNMIFLALTVVFFGTMASLAVFFWFSKPMRQLIKGLNKNSDFTKPAFRNEMDILSSAFTQIEHKEKELRDLLNEREKDATILAIRNLLSDDPLTAQETETLSQVFPHRLFRVAIAVLDNYEDYRRRTNAEQRAYQRYLFISQSIELTKPPLILRGVYLPEARIALIINMEEEIDADTLAPLLSKLQETAAPVFGTTITIGCSETGFEFDGVQQCLHQASEAVAMRILRGSNNIIRWTGTEGRKRFFYPQNSEVRILNYLNTGNLAMINAELDSISKTIRGADGISYDNICFIYNQLAGGTIRRLSEMNTNTSGFFFNHGNVYRSIASSETLEQLSKYMTDFYGDLINYLHKDQGEDTAIDRILACLGKYYKTDMFFEDMALELNMSYSYMRRIVKEKTGKSVNDTVNLLRIQEAKILLLDEKLKLPDVAKAAGYRNTQSLKRYFKKFEGLNPLEYRAAGKIRN
ncbi:MAG: helix-turn-helix domain-containing protein [Treponema sp.]|nr:helix-turn-helix domain-containing protein [Treponema sp.]